jgi:hypothetical protein
MRRIILEMKRERNYLAGDKKRFSLLWTVRPSVTPFGVVRWLAGEIGQAADYIESPVSRAPVDSRCLAKSPLVSTYG